MKKLILSLSLVMFVVFCVGAVYSANEALSIGLTSNKATRQTALVTAVGSKAKDVASYTVTALDDLKAKFNCLDYNRSKDFSILVPGINQEVVLDWGFAGSGDVFQPLMPIKIKWKSPSVETNNGVSLAEFLRVVAQNEMAKNSFQLPALSWLGVSGYEPVKVFAIKAALLLTNKAQGKKAPDIKQELVRLLVRLSLSDNGTVLAGKRLSGFIPATIRELISSSMTHGELEKTLEFIDQIWAILVGNSTKPELNDIQGLGNSYCFIFNDPAIARDCYEKFSAYKEGDLSTQLNEYVSKRGYEVEADPAEFTKFDATIPAGTPVKVYEPAKKIIGFRSFGSSTSAEAINALPVTVKAAIQQSLNDHHVVLADSQDGHSWLVYATHNMSYVDAFSFAMISIVKAIKEYSNVKKISVESASKLREEINKEEEQINQIKEDIVLLNEAIRSKQIQIRSLRQRASRWTFKGTNDSIIRKCEAEVVELQSEVARKNIQLKSLLAKVRSSKEAANELMTFAKDMCGDSPDLAGIREQLVLSLSKVIKNTEHFKSNMPVYEYLVKCFKLYMPELTPILAQAFSVAKKD